MRTSLTDPIRVDWLLDGNAGRIGLTFAPGKRCEGIEGKWERDLDLDLAALTAHGVQTLACLLEDHELARFCIADLPTKAAGFGLRFERLPIPDAGIPADAEAAARLVALLAAEVRAGRHVVVHCRGGLGRAGTVGACVLLQLGECANAGDAIAHVRARRGAGAIETAGQERFVAGFARRLA